MTATDITTKAQKPPLTPKAIIHQKYGDKASYKIIEQVQQQQQENQVCPGLSLPQKTPPLFVCHLQLPDGFSVTSPPCKRKKEAEQCAAKLALDKLDIDSQKRTPVVSDPADELVSRLSYMFTGEFLSSKNPLSGHLKAVFRREGELNGAVPLSVLIACDTKLGNLCKSINQSVEINPFMCVPLILRASLRLPELISVSEEELWMKMQKPYPSDLVSLLDNQNSDMTNGACVEAVYVPSSVDRDVRSISLNLQSKAYYLDVIAQELCLMDASKVLISRTVGKSSSELRLYFSALETDNLNPLADLSPDKGLSSFGSTINVRASYLLGQQIYGDAILASIGYTWRGAELFREDVSLRSYFRMLVGKTPDGLYKISRNAILMAELPSSFTTKANWRGLLPRDILCAFCRQHRLSEPAFNIICEPLVSEQEVTVKQVANGAGTEVKNENGVAPGTGGQNVEFESFRCEVKLLSKNQDLILQINPEKSFKKQGDAIQTSSLGVLLWLNRYFKQLEMTSEMSHDLIGSDMQCHSASLSKEFFLCHLISDVRESRSSQGGQRLVLNHIDLQKDTSCDGLEHFDVEGPHSGSLISNGSVVCISYNVNLFTERKDISEILERKDEFEFEIGTGTVIPVIEAALLQMTVGQSTRIRMDLPCHELVLAAAKDSQNVISLLSSKACFLEYSITLMQVTQPFEDRIEQALFSPPLSKQRVEYALQCVKELSATSLIDFGCGSGSLLESLLERPSYLEKIVGVDISPKGLIRAAKSLSSKLEQVKAVMPLSRIKSAILYDGSITVFDSRLFGFDIGTCLEVIEHMEEDQACVFGDVALGQFRPKILIVSTPNYEYNVILQKSNIASQEEDPDEKGQLQACKFRNHDHKFEWTRKQFNRWASDLASKHNYNVEFGGVGGVAGVEPGFASQIAVFRRNECQPMEDGAENMEIQHHYDTIWEWNA